MIVKIKDIYITKVQPNGTFLPYPVEESAYYQSLFDGKEVYNKYLQELADWHYKLPVDIIPETTFEEFNSLYNNIVAFGFTIDPHITIKNNLVLDGQHRLSILYFIFRDKFALEIEKEKVVNIWEPLSILSKMK